jgi:general secretion pathway protein K
MKMRISNCYSLKRGATLIAVFWIMAVMGLALVATVKISRYQSDAASSQINGIEARQYAEMGINLAANPAVEEWDPILRQTFENGAGFEAKILSEGGRFNINFILFQEDKKLLRDIFQKWGIDFDVASEIADALIDWIDSNDDVNLNGAEFDYYEGQGFFNRPFNRPFYDLDEVRLVRGMNMVEAANPGWRNWFTVWSSGGLDVQEAPAEFIAMATETNIEETVGIVEIVDGADGIRNTEDDQPLSADEVISNLGVDDPSGVIRGRLNSGDQVNRIESVGFAGSVRRKVVLIINNRSRNPSILDRKEVVIQ